MFPTLDKLSSTSVTQIGGAHQVTEPETFWLSRGSQHCIVYACLSSCDYHYIAGEKQFFSWS